MTKSHGNTERALGFGQKDGWRARGSPERRKDSFWPEKISSQQFFLAGCGEEEHEVEAVWCSGGLLPRAGGLSSGWATGDICLIILSSF